MKEHVFIKSHEQIIEGGIGLIEQFDAQASQYIWVDIEGELSATAKQKLVELGCHELAMNAYLQQPNAMKVEQFPNMLFMLFKEQASCTDDLSFEHQQVAMFLGERFLITVRPSRSAEQNAQLAHQYCSRANTASQLAIMILQSVTRCYLDNVRSFEQLLEQKEDALQGGEQKETLNDLVNYRYQFRRLSRLFEHHNDLLLQISGEPEPFLNLTTVKDKHEWNKILERSRRLTGLTRMYYDICGDLLDGHITTSTHDLNNTIKILTMITAVFVPLGFIAGIYGMNFENMPELEFEYGYFAVLTFKVLIAASFFWVFKKKKWID
ncbi:hypothetical protein EZV61_13870 [Corallincola luteus]|uniref:Magnesium transporter n=1 Tax=Corallincola luteus TaxID=1775177 RepID=A0ABY2ALQ2_9GAMM|nr:magnesium transporter CorA family protein [Corallincola luteus]TCI02440.1 hypothetical protein EZV61_13870 [Corallincola luteus]